jgi:hypothetical protein
MDALHTHCALMRRCRGYLAPEAFRTSAQLLRGNTTAAKGVPVGKGQGVEQISESARQQITALIQEKNARSAGRRKMDSRLIYGIKMEQGEQVAAGIDTLDVRLPLDDDGEVIVDITANVTKQLLAKLKQFGAKVVISHPQYRSIRVETPLSVVDEIANLPEVIYIQPKQEAMVWQEDAPQDFNPQRLQRTRPGFEERERNISQQLENALNDFQLNSYTSTNGGVRKSEADATHKALIGRNTYGFDGTGIKIGVLSNGVRNLAAAQASGDLGPVTVLAGQSGIAAGQCATTVSCDEGTAMLELVHDIAPGAQLYFATALPTAANFAQNIRDLRTAGCDIIVDDVFYFAESPFQDGQAPAVVSPTNGGVVTQAVNDVTAAGALYFSSAGNSGNKNDNTSGVWEGDYVDGGPAAAPIGAANGNVHTFPADGATPAQPFNVVVTVGSGQYNLNWSDPLGGSGNDYDLYALNAAGTTVVTASTSTQDGNDDPFEAIAPTAAGTRLVIVKFTGVGRFLRLTTNRGRLTVNTPGQTTAHSCAADAFGVAATPAIGPFPSPFNSSNVLETFSSDGPRRIFFQPDGTAFTPGNVSSTGGIVRQKPDITAADGTSVTGAGGFGIQFFGTSAAAPHAAAIAALLKSANPSLTLAQVRTALNTSAIDIEAPGTDRDSGVGIIMADTALQAIGAASGAANLTIGTATVTDIGGNTNGYIEPGERATLNIPLNNTGINPATTVSATLSSTTTGVFITPSATRTYADIAATSGTSTNATPFEFVYQTTGVYAADINFVLTVTYNGGIVRSFPFIIPTGQLALISGQLDATATASGPNFTATTGTQTGRVGFSFPISGCGSTKATPTAVATGARRYDAYTFTNTSGATICAQILLSHSANALIHAVAYNTFTPATPSVGYAGDGGGSATVGAGTAQFFSISVAPSASFTVVVSESNAGGAPNVAYNLRVTGLPAAAVPANVAPINAVPGAQSTNRNTAKVFSSGNSNQISVSDTDSGNNPLQVTLTGTNGDITLNGTTGLSFTAGDGTADATMTFTGSATAINNALNGLSFNPTTNFSGPASLAINTGDQGFTGTGGPQSDSDTVNINVVAVPGNIQFTSATYSDSETNADHTFNAVVTRTGGADGAVSVDFAVTDGTATVAGNDYTASPSSGTLNWADGDATSRNVTITVKGDTTIEANETVNFALSNVLGGASLGSPSSAVLTITNDDAATAGQLIISEFRLRGPNPNGAQNEFVEIYNNTNSSQTVGSTDGSAGYGVVASDGALRCTIPNGTVIPANGHFLCTNSVGYSLAGYASGDASYTTDIPDNAGIALFSSTTTFTLPNRLDAVGSTSEANTLYKEGTGYPALTPFSIDYSFRRDDCGKQGSITTMGTCPSGGAVVDTDDNATNFYFVDTNGTSAGAGQRLGAPGPENLASPIVRTTIDVPLLDATTAAANPPNRVRDFTSDPANNSTFGTLDIRRRVVNNTGASVTRLRFRVVDITTFPAPSGFADLRTRTSTLVVVSGINDAATCLASNGVATTPCTVNVQGTTLEQPPSQLNGGAFGSSYSAGTITLGTPLANGASINVRFLLGIQQTGSFKFYFNIEALP